MGKKMLGQKDEYRGGWRKMEGERSSIHEAFCFLPYMFCQCLLILAETQGLRVVMIRLADGVEMRWGMNCCGRKQQRTAVLH
jgi:hypothetical protein